MADQNLNQEQIIHKKVGLFRSLGVLILPVLFAWSITTKNGYTRTAMVLSYAWLAMFSLSYFVGKYGQDDSRYTEQVSLYKKQIAIYEVFKVMADSKFETLANEGSQKVKDELIALCDEFTKKIENVPPIELIKACHETERERCYAIEVNEVNEVRKIVLKELNNLSRDCHIGLLSANDYEKKLNAIEHLSLEKAHEISIIWVEELSEQIKSLMAAIKSDNDTETLRNLNLISDGTCESRPPLSDRFNRLAASMQSFCESFKVFKVSALNFASKEKTASEFENLKIIMKGAEEDVSRKLDDLTDEMNKLGSQI